MTPLPHPPPPQSDALTAQACRPAERRIEIRLTEAIGMLERIRQALPGHEAGARVAVHQLHALLAGPAPEERRIRRGGLAAWQQRKVERVMRAGLDGSLTLLDMAQSVSLSVSHFTRAFRVSFGRTAHEHLMWLRIERAQHLMRTTETSLVQIALDCGFSDQAHLCKAFRRFVGETPSGWRRRHALEGWAGASADVGRRHEALGGGFASPEL